MSNKFAYINEDDKCYGLSGMVISLNVFENDDMLMEVSLDNDDAISFTPDFFFNSNPRFSAKTAWNEMIKQYQLLTALVMGNVMCRYRVRQHRPLTPEAIKEIHAIIEDEGHDLCSLEDDEIDMIFNKTLSYLDNVYMNRQVSAIADGLASAIKHKRTLSGDEVRDELEALRRR